MLENRKPQFEDSTSIWDVISRAHICHEYHELYLWRKKMSCGEIWPFYKEFEQFMEFYQSLCRFCSKSMWRKICMEKICVEKK